MSFFQHYSYNMTYLLNADTPLIQTRSMIPLRTMGLTVQKSCMENLIFPYLCLLQLAVGQLTQVEQNLEFARDLQKNITQIYAEVSDNRDLNLKSCHKSISISKIHHLIVRAVVAFPLLIFLICPQPSGWIWNVYDFQFFISQQNLGLSGNSKIPSGISPTYEQQA